MATTLTGSVVRFPDSTEQSQRKGYTIGTAYTTHGVYTATITGIPKNAQKIVLNIEKGDPSGGPVYTTLAVKSQNGTSSFSNDVNAVAAVGTQSITYGSILGSYNNYLSYSYGTRIIFDLIALNPGSMPYYYVEIISVHSSAVLAAGTIYNSATGGIDTISLSFSGGYYFSNPRIGISWE